MVFEIGDFAESPVADVAAVGPGPVVDVHVGLEVAGRRETLLAQLALMWLVLENKERKKILVQFIHKI